MEKETSNTPLEIDINTQMSKNTPNKNVLYPSQYQFDLALIKIIQNNVSSERIMDESGFWDTGMHPTEQ